MAEFDPPPDYPPPPPLFLGGAATRECLNFLSGHVLSRTTAATVAIRATRAYSACVTLSGVPLISKLS